MASGYSDLSEIRKDRGVYGLHQKPAKINLLNEKPRRESLIEQQLTSSIVRPTLYDQVNYQHEQQSSYGQAQEQRFNMAGPSRQQPNYGEDTRSLPQHQKQQLTSPFVMCPGGTSTSSYSYSSGPGQTTTVTTKVTRKLIAENRPASAPMREPPPIPQPMVTQRTSVNIDNNNNTTYTELVNDLAEKQAKLRREMAYLNQQLSPWARPPQIREPRREPRAVRSEQRWVKECPSGSSSRPNSRASSTRSTTELDLMEKADRLLKDVEELEKKPLKTQQILIESGAQPRSSSSPGSSTGVSGIHTAIIKVPVTEIDNKSPLPFAFDNFSTLGVRGNIASVGAAPPETPYPPIFPTMKRTPSPMMRKG